MNGEKIVEFLRKKDFILIKDLGQGACGKTVLLRDDLIDEYFVCKKFQPFDEASRNELFNKFIDEVKILHRIHHDNIVRVYNYFLYPDAFAGYMLMEYIEGDDIETYLSTHPELINEIFISVINGFYYLENNNILHRDIRPYNILIKEDGTVKIIDFGFGKKIVTDKDFSNSISLKWWCEPPSEFVDHIYDFSTEVYFIGKMFEQIIAENEIEVFIYPGLLRNMCQKDPGKRISSFSDVYKQILNKDFDNIDFSFEETQAYRTFSETLYNTINKIESNAKYITDIDSISKCLLDLYKKSMLEEKIPDNSSIIKCFINGAYYYVRNDFPVFILRDFNNLLKSCQREKKNIILSNLHTKLDSIERYGNSEFEDDIPF